MGSSPAPSTPEAGSYWNQAADIETLREHLGQAALTLVAHSAGTRLAIAYAAQYPDRVGRLLLVTPPAGYLVTVPSDSDEAWQQTTAPAGYAAWTEKEQAHAKEAAGTWTRCSPTSASPRRRTYRPAWLTCRFRYA